MAFCCPLERTWCFLKTPPNHNCQPEYKMPCCSWWGFHPRLALTVFFLQGKKVTVVYCHLWCLRKLVSACSGKTRHWFFGLFALLQEMWLICGSRVLALSPASSCKCRGCDGICAESHCKTGHKGCAQDNMQDRGEAGHGVQPFALGSLCPHTRTRNYLSQPCKPMREPRRGKALKRCPSIHPALHHML